MKEPEEIAQWVIDNRYPKSEWQKVPDAEMFNYIVSEIKESSLSQPTDAQIEEAGLALTKSRTDFSIGRKIGFVEGARWLRSL